jgi:hypothetical protein
MVQIFADPVATQQSTTETKAYVVDVGPYIEGQSGVSVASATGTLTDPSSTAAALVNTPTVSGTEVVALVTAAEVDETGDWTLDVLVTLTGSSEQPEFRYQINVPH